MIKLNTKQTYLMINKALQYAIQSSNDQDSQQVIQIGPVNQNNYRQLWLLSYIDNQSHQIINGWTDNVITKDLINLKLKRGERHHRQLWTLQLSTDKEYYIRYSKSKDRYLCIINGNLMLKQVKTKNQADLWIFQLVTNNAILNNSCFIRQSTTKQLIDVPHGSKKHCQQLIIWKQHHRFNQRWNIYRAGQIYVIKSFYNNLNLDVEQQKFEQGTHIIQYQNHGNVNQFWRFEKIEGNKYRISTCVNRQLELGHHGNKLILCKSRKYIWQIQGYFPQ